MTRPTCPQCQRPRSTCICQWITPTAHQTEVLILQHPLEANHAKNTARLLHLSLPRSQVLTGEAFDEACLQAALAGPKYTVLLYPPDVYQGHEAAAPLEATQLRDPSNVRLLVLDGTWRKSRKMLHLSPPLQRLPRLSLDETQPSGYAIRKAHKPGQLSTLEATCAALAHIDGRPEIFKPLLTAFDGFVAQQLGYSSKNRLQGA